MPAVSQRSHGTGRGRRMMNEINVVPYIDVMLVLLVIFMVTAPMLPPAEIQLPSAGAAKAPPERYVEVQIRSETDLRVRTVNAGDAETRQIKRGDLASVLGRIRGDADMPVMISADQSVNYGTVIGVLDELKRQNVGRVGLSVKPER